MRLPLHPYPTLLPLPLPAAPNAPPLLFIKEEPFLVELQGSLEIEGRPGVEGGREEMRGVQVGMVNFEEETRPILQIAHHRLEGKLVTLAEPYAILRTTPASHPRSTKKPRLDSELDSALDPQEELAPTIEIVALVRRKIVFSKRPEPIAEPALVAGAGAAAGGR